MTSKPPPVPPDNRSHKGAGEQKRPDPNQRPGGDRRKNPEEPGQVANTKQNTRHQGYQQDR